MAENAATDDLLPVDMLAEAFQILVLPFMNEAVDHRLFLSAMKGVVVLRFGILLVRQRASLQMRRAEVGKHAAFNGAGLDLSQSGAH